MDSNHNANCVYQGRCNNYKCLSCYPNNVEHIDLLNKAAAPKKMDISDMFFYGVGGFLGFCLFIIFIPLTGPISFLLYAKNSLGKGN